jgi:hypothetical protein
LNLTYRRIKCVGVVEMADTTTDMSSLAVVLGYLHMGIEYTK